MIQGQPTRLKARQNPWYFIVLHSLSMIAIFAGIWVFVRTEDFSFYNAVTFLGGLSIFILLVYYLTIIFRIGQSVELTDEGVWSLVWER